MNKKTTDQIKNNVRYYSNLKKQMEISETKSKAVYFRRHILERQINGELPQRVRQDKRRVKQTHFTRRNSRRSRR